MTLPLTSSTAPCALSELTVSSGWLTGWQWRRAGARWGAAPTHQHWRIAGAPLCAYMCSVLMNQQQIWAVMSAFLVVRHTHTHILLLTLANSNTRMHSTTAGSDKVQIQFSPLVRFSPDDLTVPLITHLPGTPQKMGLGPQILLNYNKTWVEKWGWISISIDCGRGNSGNGMATFNKEVLPDLAPSAVMPIGFLVIE